MEVEEVQSRSASVVHRNGQNMSAAQMTAAAVPGSMLLRKPHLDYVSDPMTMTRMLKKWSGVVWGFRRLMPLLWTDVVAAKYLLPMMGGAWCP